MQRREMHGGPQFVHQPRGYELMSAEMRAPVHDAMAHGHWRRLKMLVNRSLLER